MVDPVYFTDGDVYERLMGKWSQQVGREFLRWLDVGSQRQWLDTGCGTGAFTELIVSEAHPKSVDGIDPSSEQIAFAQKRLSTRMAKFQAGDAQKLPFADNSFDIAAMALVVAFVPDPLKAVNEMRRVTRKGGIVASYMWDLPADGVPMWPVNVAIKEMGLERPAPASARVSAKEPLEQLWRNAGMENVRTREIRIPVHFRNADEFVTSVLLPVGPIGVFVKGLTANQQEELASRVRGAVKPAADGAVRYEAFANAISGVVP